MERSRLLKLTTHGEWPHFIEALQKAEPGEVIFALIRSASAERALRCALACCLPRPSIRFDAHLFLLRPCARVMPALFSSPGLIQSTGWVNMSLNTQRTALDGYLPAWQRAPGPTLIWATEESLALIRETAAALWNSRQGIYDMRGMTWGEVLPSFLSLCGRTDASLSSRQP